jgi:hypothetical protein
MGNPQKIRPFQLGSSRTHHLDEVTFAVVGHRFHTFGAVEARDHGAASLEPTSVRLNVLLSPQIAFGLTISPSLY